MRINYRWALGLSVVSPRGENRGWCYLSVLEGLAERLRMPNPYRNPDRTFTSLIMFMGWSYEYE